MGITRPPLGVKDYMEGMEDRDQDGCQDWKDKDTAVLKTASFALPFS